jgi:uncharacterized protein (UPF0548 family)
LFYLSSPTDEEIRALLRARAEAPFTYKDVGVTRDELSVAPSGFKLDRYGTELGRGQEVFERAREVLGKIGNYPPSFTRVVRLTDVIEPGMMFATVASHFGFVSVHPCRMIFVEQNEHRLAFGFGTLRGHAESGEERFEVSIREDVVRYDVQAFSRPDGWVARIGAPVNRAFQLRFQRETKAWMGSLTDLV